MKCQYNFRIFSCSMPTSWEPDDAAERVYDLLGILLLNCDHAGTIPIISGSSTTRTLFPLFRYDNDAMFISSCIVSKYCHIVFASHFLCPKWAAARQTGSKSKSQSGGDFNAVIGNPIPGADMALLGTCGFGPRNDRGWMLVRWVLEHGLFIRIEMFDTRTVGLANVIS